MQKIILLLLLPVSLHAQSIKNDTSTACRFISKLCNEVTQHNPRRSIILDNLNQTDTVNYFSGTDCFVSLVDGFTEDSCYYTPQIITDEDLMNPSGWALRSYQKNGKLYYDIDITLHSNYTMNKQGKIVYAANYNLAISYPELNRILGKPVSAMIQPKDKKYYYYRYVNLASGRVAVIKVTSFNPPYSNYNTIYSISMINKELDEDIDLILEKPLKPKRRVSNGRKNK